MKNLWKLMYIENSGYPEVHTDGLSYEEAIEMEKGHNETFPDTEYFIEAYPAPEFKPRTNRTVPFGQADGWEDLYTY